MKAESCSRCQHSVQNPGLAPGFLLLDPGDAVSGVGDGPASIAGASAAPEHRKSRPRYHISWVNPVAAEQRDRVERYRQHHAAIFGSFPDRHRPAEQVEYQPSRLDEVGRRQQPVRGR